MIDFNPDNVDYCDGCIHKPIYAYTKTFNATVRELNGLLPLKKDLPTCMRVGLVCDYRSKGY